MLDFLYLPTYRIYSAGKNTGGQIVACAIHYANEATLIVRIANYRQMWPVYILYPETVSKA